MPFDRTKYPENWLTEIRPRILARAGEVRNDAGEIIEQACCEYPGCGVENSSEIMRDIDGHPHARDDGFWDSYEYPETAKWVKIVLTIAHVDHDETNCADEDLRAWCQLHHLRHDIRQHALNARKTRERKTGQLILIEESTGRT